MVLQESRKQMSFRVDEREANRIEKAAELAGMSVAELIRTIVLLHLDEYVKTIHSERQRKMDEFLKGR